MEKKEKKKTKFETFAAQSHEYFELSYFQVRKVDGMRTSCNYKFKRDYRVFRTLL